MCHEKYSFLPWRRSAAVAAAAASGASGSSVLRGEEGKLVVLMRDYIVHMTFFDISVPLLGGG